MRRQQGRAFSALRNLTALAGMLLTLSGCTFWHSNGGGPLLKDAAYAIYGRAPRVLTSAEKADYDQLFQMAYWQGIPQTIATASGQSTLARQRITHDFSALPVIGYWTSQNALLVGEKDKQWHLVGKTTGFAPLFPLAVVAFASWETWFHLDEADEAASREHLGLGPLGLVIGYSHAVTPATLPPEASNICLCGPAAASRQLAATLAGGTDAIRYNSRSAWHVLGGLLAWGRVNQRRFVQLAWIPVPLWEITP